MSEQRAQPRLGLIHFQQVRDAASGELLGYVADIHAEGLRIAGKVPLGVGERRRLELRYLRHGGSAESLDADTECIWSEIREGALAAEAGLRFAGLDEAARETLERILEDLRTRP